MLIEPQTTLQEERKKFRQERVKQARQLANVAAKQIRNRVKFTRDTLQKEAEDEVFRQLVAQQMAVIEEAAETVEATYRTEVGRAYEEAAFVEKKQASKQEAEYLHSLRESKRASQRFDVAKSRLDAERADSCKEEIYRRLARQSALEIEMERTRSIISRPLPPKNEVEKVAAELEETKRRPFRVLESNVYQATRYHLGFDDDDKLVTKPQKVDELKISRVKVSSTNCCDADDKDSMPLNTKQRAPQPTKKEIFPFVEQPADKEASLGVSQPLAVVAEKEAEAKRRRDELMEKARVRGEAALKEERDSRQFDKLLTDLNTLQQVWRRHDVNSQPHIVAGRLYVGADHVDAEKRAHQQRLEAAFNPVVMSAAANLPKQITGGVGEDSDKETVLSSPSSSETKSSESSESAVGSFVSADGFAWQEASVTTDEHTTTEQSSYGTDYGTQESEDSSATTVSSHNEEEHSETLTEPPALESQSPPTPNVAPPVYRQQEEATPSSVTSSDRIETGIIPPHQTSTYSVTASSLSGGSLSGSDVSFQAISAGQQLQQPQPQPPSSSSSFNWLMEHNRLLMAKIDSHRRQIEDQRHALSKRLEQLNVRVASPLRTRLVHHSPMTSTSAPSTTIRPSQDEDRSVLLFSPSLTSSFLSDATPKQFVPWGSAPAVGANNSSSSSSSSDSSASAISTGPLSLSSSSTSSTSSSSLSSPSELSHHAVDTQKPFLSTLQEESSSLSTGSQSQHDFSLLIEQSMSASSVVAAGGAAANRLEQVSGNEYSSMGSTLDFHTIAQPGEASTSSSSYNSNGNNNINQNAPMPALSSTPRREAFSSSPHATSSRRPDTESAATSNPLAAPSGNSPSSGSTGSSPPFRSLLLDAGDEDDFDLPPPSLVGDDSFLDQMPDDN